MKTQNDHDEDGDEQYDEENHKSERIQKNINNPTPTGDYYSFDSFTDN